MKSKKLATLGLLVGTSVGGGVGLLLSATGSAGASAGSAVAVVDQAAVEGADGERPDPSARLAEVLAPLVADGTLTQEQADKVIAALVEARPEGGSGRHGGRGFDTVAETLGVTVDELRTALADGQTIADVAAANGSSGQAVIDALVAEAKAHLDEEVAAGELTADEAATRLTEITERITTFVNETPQPGEGGRGPGGHGPRGGDSTDDAATDDAATDSESGS